MNHKRQRHKVARAGHIRYNESNERSAWLTNFIAECSQAIKTNRESGQVWIRREDLSKLHEIRERLFFASIPAASPELIAEARRQGKLPPDETEAHPDDAPDSTAKFAELVRNAAEWDRMFDAWVKHQAGLPWDVPLWPNPDWSQDVAMIAHALAGSAAAAVPPPSSTERMPYLLSTYRSEDRVIIQCENVDKAEEALSRVMASLHSQVGTTTPQCEFPMCHGEHATDDVHCKATCVVQGETRRCEREPNHGGEHVVQRRNATPFRWNSPEKTAAEE
jgi:hypothetical protein